MLGREKAAYVAAGARLEVRRGLTALSQWRLFAGVVTQGDASLLGARPTLEAEGEHGPGGDKEDPQVAILPRVASVRSPSYLSSCSELGQAG